MQALYEFILDVYFLFIIFYVEYGLTTNGRKFLDKFQLKNLSEKLKFNVNVTNATISNDLKQFHERTLPHVSKFLYTEGDMFDQSYNKRKLNEIFLQMKFFTVDNIEVTYEYKDISFDHSYSCYFDQKFKKFYLLKTQHYSQSIDTMIQFIINDTIQECQYKRDKLDKYYRKLLTAYSKNQLEQSIIINDNEETKLTWKINENNEEIDENKVEDDIDNDEKDFSTSTNPKLAAEIYDEEETIIPKPKIKQKQIYPQVNINNSNFDINKHDRTNKSTIDNVNQSTTTIRKEHQQLGNVYYSNDLLLCCRKNNYYDRGGSKIVSVSHKSRFWGFPSLPHGRDIA